MSDEEIVGPSNRSFGILFVVVFTTVGLLPLWRGGPVRSWALVVAAMFGLAALVVPQALAPLNAAWLRLGLVLHRVVSPVIMGGLFYLAVTPFGLVMQLLRKGLVRRLRPDHTASSYWIDRRAQPASRMDQQF